MHFSRALALEQFCHTFSRDCFPSRRNSALQSCWAVPAIPAADQDLIQWPDWILASVCDTQPFACLGYDRTFVIIIILLQQSPCSITAHCSCFSSFYGKKDSGPWQVHPETAIPISPVPWIPISLSICLSLAWTDSITLNHLWFYLFLKLLREYPRTCWLF